MHSLESKLIDPDQWDTLYEQMPKHCQETVDRLRESPDCIGIGYYAEIGWFIVGAGQGPCLLWSEKGTT